ncbi:MAG: glycosyltransferase family 4 protein [Holophagales bacterium]|nr:glycosyltransferase family 4 protein [Holophagales bacterium]
MPAPEPPAGQVPIVFTQPNFLTAGSGQLVLEIAAGLDRRRFRPIICLHRRGGALEERAREHGIELLEAVPTVPARPYLSLLPRAHRAARRMLEAGVPDGALWHSFHYLDDYTEPLVARFARARAWVYSKKSMSWGSRAWWLRSQLADRILCLNTEMVEAFFASPRLRRKTELAPPGVDIEAYHPRSAPRIGSPACAGNLVVGCVAHLLPVKGQTTLIEAAARCPWLELRLAGRPLEPDYVRQLEQRIDQLGVGDRVSFLGQVDDVPSLHHELDIFVLPTLAEGRMEGCPVALLEAMASGLPVIATRIPGANDVVEPGESGLLVPARDVEALTAALEQLRSEDERRRLGQGARRRIEEGYTLSHEVAVHEAVYSRLLAPRGR